MTKITKVKIQRVFFTDKPVIGIADIVLNGDIGIDGIRIISRKDKLFLTFPSVPIKGKLQNVIHPMNQQTRDHITEEVLKAYQEERDRYILTKAGC